ncbi:MAG: signal recognition particle-docking protein FtsY [Desulfuromonadales bacterium]|nr:signal recognition particle-docking protein FtsY [Desulfuromonadales bacterium]
MAIGLFGRLREGLAKTRETLIGKVEALFQGHPKIDEGFLESLEEILLGADFGMPVTQDLITALRRRLKTERDPDLGRLREIMAEEIGARLQSDRPWALPTQRPCVIMLVGVNGVGKTTTIGKLAAQFVGEGKRVVIGAGDTFRAAAAEQLQIWGERAGAEVIRHAEGADPGAVAFDAARAAVARGADVLLLDTAGRLHTKVNLMEELKKVRRVLAREIPGAPHETWLVLDATTGQNALAQARTFCAAVEATGLVLTKLDGTAKGGIVVAIGTELGIGVRFVGIGEGVADLRPFNAAEFVAALFQNE